MSETKKRKFHTPEYKAKVALEALRSGKTINQIGQEFDVHPVQVGLWKKAIQEQAKTLFEGTSADFTGVLKREGIKISMDGRGRAFDNIFVERLWRNVKYEDVYLKGYATVGELLLGLSDYFVLYNRRRPHQSLQYKTPDVVYASASGGGAMIIDKYGEKAGAEKPNSLSATDNIALHDG